MYVIREFEPYSRYAPLYRIKVHGIMMAVYSESEQPYVLDEGESEQAIVKKWSIAEDARAYLRQMQRINGVERKEQF